MHISQRKFKPDKCPATRKELFYYLSSIGLDRFDVVKEGPKYAVIIAGPKPRICATQNRCISNWTFDGWAKACLDLEAGYGQLHRP